MALYLQREHGAAVEHRGRQFQAAGHNTKSRQTLRLSVNRKRGKNLYDCLASGSDPDSALLNP
jgi:hypothetical protein